MAVPELNGIVFTSCYLKYISALSLDKDTQDPGSIPQKKGWSFKIGRLLKKRRPSSCVQSKLEIIAGMTSLEAIKIMKKSLAQLLMNNTQPLRSPRKLFSKPELISEAKDLPQELCNAFTWLASQNIQYIKVDSEKLHLNEVIDRFQHHALFQYALTPFQSRLEQIKENVIKQYASHFKAPLSEPIHEDNNKYEIASEKLLLKLLGDDAGEESAPEGYLSIKYAVLSYPLFSHNGAFFDVLFRVLKRDDLMTVQKLTLIKFCVKWLKVYQNSQLYNQYIHQIMMNIALFCYENPKELIKEYGQIFSSLLKNKDKAPIEEEEEEIDNDNLVQQLSFPEIDHDYFDTCVSSFQKQITLYVINQFKAISTHEWLNCVTKQEHEQIKYLTQIANKLSGFAAVHVFGNFKEGYTIHEFVARYSFFVKLIEQCLQQHDLFSASCLFVGIQHSAISKVISDCNLNIHQKLIEQFDDTFSPLLNFKNIRAKMNNVESPVIPPLFIPLKDLTFYLEGEPILITDETVKFNVPKIRTIAIYIESIQKNIKRLHSFPCLQNSLIHHILTSPTCDEVYHNMKAARDSLISSSPGMTKAKSLDTVGHLRRLRQINAELMEIFQSSKKDSPRVKRDSKTDLT